MTVYSKESGLSSEKKDLIVESVTVDVVCPEKKGLTAELQDVPLDTESNVYNDPVVPIRRQPRPASQKRLCLQLCLFIGMLTGLSISILASLYLYRTMSVDDLRYRGRCGVGIVSMPNYNVTGTSQPQALSASTQETFDEQVDINGNRETISVPRSNDDKYSSADITHDFNKNMTAIKDLETNFCYLLPLLYGQLVPSPYEFYETLESMQTDDTLPYLVEYVSDYTICTGAGCYEGSVDDLVDLCGQYRPLFAQPIVNIPAMTTPSTTTGLETPTDIDSTAELIKTLDRMFRSFAGGDAVVTYHVYSYDDI